MVTSNMNTPTILITLDCFVGFLQQLCEILSTDNLQSLYSHKDKPIVEMSLTCKFMQRKKNHKRSK